MATLYRCRTHTDWLCPCGRVARALRANGIDHDQVRVRPWAGRAEVRAISGQPRVPLLVLDGEAICDSHRIVEHLRWRAAQRDPRPGRDGPGDPVARAG